MADKPIAAAPLPDRIRHRFPIFERLVYINSCSQGALSDAVRDSYEQYLGDWEEHGAPWEYWVERTEAARAAFAHLVNAEPDEIAVTTSLSAGVSALASGLRYAKRSKIVTTDLEFPTVGQIWHAQESRGARVVHVPLDGFKNAIDDDTALVSITHVSYRTGEMIDVRAVVELAHERGALVLLDAYQSAGSVPLDVKELGVDFLSAGTVKYLLGSAGLAFFYCRRELFERAWPTATGWFADQDIFQMDAWDYSPSATARRFQSGTPPIPSIYAGIAGIELMEEIGIEETREHVLGLNAHLIAGIEELGGTVVTPQKRKRHGALICVRSNDVNELVDALGRWGIVTSERDGNLRISPHAYNSREDIDLVLEALAHNKKLLG
ncbi:MAG: aminotransferase class V-fold PLP-dependent enzyme [Gaiellaceae bacterium]